MRISHILYSGKNTGSASKKYYDCSNCCIRILLFHQQILTKTHRNSPRVSLHLQIKGLCFPRLCIRQQHGFQELQDLLANWLQFIPGPMKERAQFTMVIDGSWGDPVWVETCKQTKTSPLQFINDSTIVPSKLWISMSFPLSRFHPKRILGENPISAGKINQESLPPIITSTRSLGLLFDSFILGDLVVRTSHALGGWDECGQPGIIFTIQSW